MCFFFLQCLLLVGGDGGKCVKAGEWRVKFLVVSLASQDATMHNASPWDMLQIQNYFVKDKLHDYLRQCGLPIIQYIGKTSSIPF